MAFDMKLGNVVDRSVQPGPEPNWKPYAYNPLFLLLLVVLHVSHIVGIQLLVNKHRDEEATIGLVQKNLTETGPGSMFIMEEGNVTHFLAWYYLPVAIAVILGAMWELVDVNVRRLAPFRQLSSAQGGTTTNAMCLDYTSIFGLATPFSALKRRHYTVALSSAMFILVSMVIPAVSGGIFGIEWGSVSFSKGKASGPVYAIITVNEGVATATQALHALMTGTGIILGLALFFQQTGLYRDPRGIGGLASLVSDVDRSGCATLDIFRQIPAHVHSKVVHAALDNTVFRLEHVVAQARDGTTYKTYQLVAHTARSYTLYIRPEYRIFRQDRRDSTGLWLTKRMAWLAEIILWLGQAIITAAIYYTSKFAGGEDLASRASPLIGKVVLTFCMTVGGLMWISIQRELQRFEPWRRLADEPTSLYKATVQSDIVCRGYLGGIVAGLAMGSAASLWASFCVFTVQAATIFVPPLLELVYTVGLPMGGNTGILAFSKALALSGVGIGLHVLIFVNLLFLTFGGRTRPFLPRAPTTIASQILYICNSTMLLRDFEGTSMLESDEVAERLKKAEARCRFAWFWSQQRLVRYVGVEERDEIEQWWTPFHFYGG